MTHIENLAARLEELAERDWKEAELNAHYEKLLKDGIPRKQLDPEALVANKAEILDRVQERAEAYNFLAKSCPQGTALALMEEFGIGSMEVVKALCPFPSIAGTGQLCGGVTGGLIALGLYFGSDDIRDFMKAGAIIGLGQKFLGLFEHELGYLLCKEIHKNVVFGRNMDPGASPANMEAFAEAKGFEKCGLVTGTGARLAAQVIIDGLE